VLRQWRLADLQGNSVTELEVGESYVRLRTNDIKMIDHVVIVVVLVVLHDIIFIV